MPPMPYLIDGTVRKGLHEDYIKITTTITAGGGKTVDIYVSDGSDLATSQTVSFIHVSSGETLTGTTDALGQYLIDLSALTSWSEGDSITLEVDTRSTTDELQEFVHQDAKSRKFISIDKRGKEYDEDYPYPVKIVDKLTSNPNVWGNVDTSWSITRADGQPDYEQITFPDSKAYRMTFTYNASGYLTGRSKWVRQ